MTTPGFMGHRLTSSGAFWQNRLQREAEKLKEELEQAKKREQAMQGRVEELQQQVAILKLAAGEMSEADKKTFERKLNQYIKEIDKAIAYLSE